MKKLSKTNWYLKFLYVIPISFCLCSIVQAFPLVFSGEDLGFGPPNQVPRLPSFPNANAAQSSFRGQLTNIRVEDFETLTQGSTSPVPIDFGSAGTAILSGGGFIDNMITGTFFGVYPTSGNQFWRFTEITATAFSLEFSQPQAAFGFLATDVGDFDAQLTLNLESIAGDITNLVIPHSVPSPSGSVIFYGVIDVVNPFIKATFGSTVPASVDGFGFDDFTIGTVENVVVPEPSSIWLVALGLFYLLGRQRVKGAKLQKLH